MNTATYLDTSHPAPQLLSLGRALAGNVAVAAAAIVRSSLRTVAAAAGFNRRQRAVARLSGLNIHTVRDLGFNHRDELLLAGNKRPEHRPAATTVLANDNGPSGAHMAA